MRTSISAYHRHRFPVEIISHCVWLYFRFTLSFRDIEEMLAMRGVSLSYESVREWCLKFGQTYANGLRHRSPRPGDQWHLDEVFIKINGRIHYLWRAVDQDGVVLDILVQRRQHQQAAKKFFRTLLKGCQYAPRVVIPDKRRATAQRSGRCSRVCNTDNTALSITMPSTPTSQHDSGNGTCRGARLQASPVKPTVSLGVTSAVGSSCGHDSGQIEPRVAHKLVGH